MSTFRTEEELNSEKAFYTIGIFALGGPIRAASYRKDGVNYWTEPDYEGAYSSEELIEIFEELDIEPVFHELVIKSEDRW